MGIADDIIDRTTCMLSDRWVWLSVWQDIARMVLPTEAPDMAFSMLMSAVPPRVNMATGLSGPNSPRRVKSIYDNTGMMSADRLAAGMESLVTPQSEYWHGLTIADVLKDKPTDEENIYLEKLRNYLFRMRYDPKSGFLSAHQKAMRAVVSFGTAVVYIEQDDGRYRPGDTGTPVRYCYTPIVENLLATNDYGIVDTNFRPRKYTVKQAVNKFGPDKVSPKVRGLYDTGKYSEEIMIIHAVCPRMESGSYGLEKTVKGSPIASYYVEVDTKHLIADGGYFEFPFAVYHWLQQDNSPYAESPVMLALSEIKGLQVMGKAELRAFAQWTDPPLGMPNDGVMNRPNLNPRAINPGAVGADGSLRVKPLLTAQNPDFAEKVMEVRRNQVKETLYINLFQTLIKHPEMTATEAMLRANEKGELLGPAGGKIQGGLSTMIEREVAIYGRLGVFRPTSPLAPPPSMNGASLGVKMTSPLDRLRRANEGVGTTQLLNVALPMAKVNPKILDNLDLDQTLRNLREIFGAPANMIVPESVMKQNRQASLQQEQMIKTLSAGKAAAETAKDGSIAARNAGEAAVNSPAMADALSGLLDRVRGGVSQNAPQPAIDSTNALLSQFGKPPLPRASGFPSGG